MNNPHLLPGWHFNNTYAQALPTFYVRQSPVPVRAPQLLAFNRPLATRLGLDADWLAESEGVQVFSGNLAPTGAEPIAQAYAGHQFGHFTMLGDGRALLLGEQVAPDGARFDIQLKGSGVTPFSRNGDGRAALGPMLREYLISEAMHALGIPTTLSLAVVATGEPVYREEVLPGAVLTRVAASHIRVGTFEYAAARGEMDDLKALADYAIARHYADLTEADNPYLGLLQAVIERQARLMAQWMHVGFIHGVMNTDNMAISGETIDYGPCAFMDTYDPATVFSSIDRQGRYAYANQPSIAQWNLARFAETLLPLIDENPDHALELAEAAILSFTAIYEHAWLTGMRKKLGLLDERAEDAALANDLLDLMHRHRLDYTNTLRTLALEHNLSEQNDPALQEWLKRWHTRLNQGGAALVSAAMRTANPAVIPRNHQVENALKAAVQDNDFGPFERLLSALSRPFEETPDNTDYRAPAPPSDRPYRTFCGT